MQQESVKGKKIENITEMQILHRSRHSKSRIHLFVWVGGRERKTREVENQERQWVQGRRKVGGGGGRVWAGEEEEESEEWGPA